MQQLRPIGQPRQPTNAFGQQLIAGQIVDVVVSEQVLTIGRPGYLTGVIPPNLGPQLGQFAGRPAAGRNEPVGERLAT